VEISKWVSGILRKKSASAKNFPIDAWQDARNALPLGTEIRRRPGSYPWYPTQTYSKTTRHSGCTYDGGGNDYVIEHWDDKLYRIDGSGDVQLSGTYPNTDSIMFQIGKHIFFATDSEDGSGHPYNYIISESASVFTARRASCPQISGTNVGHVSLSTINVGTGHIPAGTYRYMFTFAIYSGSVMISEGGGFDELVYTKEITLTDDSDIRITFDTSMLSGALMDHLTHVNIFRSLNIDGIWTKEELYNDPYKSSPVWPWYRFVDKKAIGATQYTYDDQISDTDLKKVYDTYDTRGWKPVPKAKFGVCAPNGRVFVMNSSFNGRVYFTENAISPNRDVTKYYEHYPEGSGYWIDVGLDIEQSDQGLIMSPIGDLLIMQDSRIFKIYQADPIRVNYLGELTGNSAIRIDNSHGCRNIKACAFGADGYLYILGNHGYRAFDGDKFVGPNYLEDANLEHINSPNTNAVYYPGEVRRTPDGKNGVNQIILSYPTTGLYDDPDECLVICFTRYGNLVTTYDGFKMIAGHFLPTLKYLIIVDKTDKHHYKFLNETSNYDRESMSNQERIEYWWQSKDFAAEDQTFTQILDSVGVYGANIDKEFEIRPVFDGIQRLNRKIITPNVDGVNTPAFLPREVRRYEVEFDDEAFGNLISIIFYTKAIVAPVVESVDLNFLLGERLI